MLNNYPYMINIWAKKANNINSIFEAHAVRNVSLSYLNPIVQKYQQLSFSFNNVTMLYEQ